MKKAILMIGIIFTLSLITLASAGDLDPTFDSDGRVITSVSPGNERASAVAIDANGKIVVAGFASNGSSNDFAVVRYNADGSLDTSFDTDGIVTTDFSSTNDIGYGVAIDSQNRIIVAGRSGLNFAVARYNPDGSLDTTFDGDGKATTSASANGNFAWSVTIDANDKIVAAGFADNGTNIDFALVRYNTNGSLDTSFDSDGIVITPFESNTREQIYGVAIDLSGKIVAAGTSGTFSTGLEFAVARYNTDGSLDTSFDTDGKTTTDFSGASSSEGLGVATDANGKIVVVGYADFRSTFEFAVVRYNTDGSLDTSFDGDGRATTNIGDSATAVAIDSSGKIIAVGGQGGTGVSNFSVVRYNPDGSLDTTFDSDGIVITDLGADDYANGVAIDSLDRIVVAGVSTDFAVARYIGVNLIVTKTADTNDGSCDLTDCSLREAIAAANSSGTNDVITFDPSLVGKTINLTMGELSVAFNGTSLTILGPGADQLTISGNNSSRAFFIDTGGNLSISGLKITGGNGTGSISALDGFGGGILNFGGNLTLTDTTVSGNSATGQDGGGIANIGSLATLTMTGSTVSGNSTTGFGGGIANSGDTTTLTNSTISGNVSANNGGGIYNGSILNMTNTTVSNNSGMNSGGIYSQSGTVNLRNSIIANSISSGNCIGVSSTINAENSLIEDSLSCVNGTNSNNLTGDPNLAPLSNYGGTTQTHALGALSIAIDAGSNALVPGSVTTDQRGFSRIVDGNNDTTATVDMGSVEKTASENIFVVTKNADTNDASCDVADCSLREAIAAANAASSDDTITFDSSLAGQTITLTLGELSIANNGTVSIIGPGADQLTVSANNSSRIFNLASGAPNGATANISGVTLTNGNSGSSEDGGAIYLDLNSSLMLTDSVVSNSTARRGGGIANIVARSLTIVGSTFSGNNSTSGGGGIFVSGVPTTITNSTISGNTAATDGGGIYISEPGTPVTLTSVTISNNSATGSGGGLYTGGDVNGSTINLRNTLIANSASGGDCVNNGVSVVTLNAEYSLIEDGLGCVNGTNSNNLTGDPNLSPLGNYGGTTQTHALLLPSPAVDTGNSFGLTTDQRGFTRPVDLRTPNASDETDIGAYEAQLRVRNVGIEGDVAPRFSGDGTVDSADIVQLRLFQINSSLLNNPETNEFQRLDTAPANTKGDGCINSADIVQASLYRINFSPITAAGGPISISCGVNLTSSSNIGSKSNKSDLLVGGVIRIEDAMGSAGSSVQVNVQVDALGDESEYGFTVNFDQNVLTYNSVATGDVNAGQTLCNQTNPGVLLCSIGDFPNIGGSTPIGEIALGQNQILARLNFTVAANATPNSQTNLTFANISAANDLATLLTINGQPGIVTILGPTAASVEVGGRVLTQDGRGVSRAIVKMTDERGNVRQAMTNPFGYYRFTDVEVGQTLIFDVLHKSHQFDPRVVSVTGQLQNLDFVAR